MTDEQPSPSVLPGLTVDEVAQSLGTKRSAVRKAIARGKMTAVLAPGKFAGDRGVYYVAPEEVERYRVDHRRP